MGATISSCCSNSGASEKDGQIDVPTTAAQSSSTLPGKDAFMQRFFEGVDVHLILQVSPHAPVTVVG